MLTPKDRDFIVAYRGGDHLVVGMYEKQTNRVTWFNKPQADGVRFFCDLELLEQDCALQNLPNNPCIATTGHWVSWLTRELIEGTGYAMIPLTQVYPRNLDDVSLLVKLRELYCDEYNSIIDETKAAMGSPDVANIMAGVVERLASLPPYVILHSRLGSYHEERDR